MRHGAVADSCEELQELTKRKREEKREGRKEMRKEGGNREREGRMERIRGYIFTSILPVSLETEKQLEQYLKGQMA